MPIRNSRLPCWEVTKIFSTRLKQQSNGSKTAVMAGANSAVNKSQEPPGCHPLCGTVRPMCPQQQESHDAIKN